MPFPPGWQNPVTAAPGCIQQGVDAQALLPSRPDLEQSRLDFQRQLLASGTARLTPIQVTADGIIWDGHHAVRAVAEKGGRVAVKVVGLALQPVGLLILDLPVR